MCIFNIFLLCAYFIIFKVFILLHLFTVTALCVYFIPSAILILHSKLGGYLFWLLIFSVLFCQNIELSLLFYKTVIILSDLVWTNKFNYLHYKLSTPLIFPSHLLNVSNTKNLFLSKFAFCVLFSILLWLPPAIYKLRLRPFLSYLPFQWKFFTYCVFSFQLSLKTNSLEFYKFKCVANFLNFDLTCRVILKTVLL